MNRDVTLSSLPSRPNTGIALFWLSAAVFVGIVVWNLSTYPPYRNALILPQTWQGAIEGVVVCGLLWLALRIRRTTICVAAMGAIAEIYLRRHGVDVAAIVDLLYFESIVLLGVVCSRWCGAPRPSHLADYLRAFVLGFIVWSVCAWTLSAIGFGSVRALRAMSIVLAVIAFASLPPPISVFVFRRLRNADPLSTLCAVLLLTWLLVLFAKTGVALNFDSLWYPLRGEYVLVGDGSVFKSMGLTSAVHYFPKLYELLLIPLSGVGSASMISGMSVLLFALFATTGFALLRQLGVENRGTRLAIVLGCVTLPAISNCAIDPKPDLLAALLLLLAWSHAMRLVESRKASDACWTAACLLLAMQAKLTAIPYAAAIVVSTVLVFFFARRTDTGVTATNQRQGWLVFGGACVVAYYVTGRTFILTGMPTIGPDALFHLWQKLGFTLIAPAGTLNWNGTANWSDTPALALDLVFRPQELLHIITFWTGNIWLWLAAVSTILVVRKCGEDTIRARYIGLSLGAVGLLLMFCLGYSIRGSDGNYYIAAIAPATLVGAACVWHRLTHAALRAAFVGCLLFFASFQAMYSFVSSNWVPGTHAFDLNFHRNLHALRRDNRQLLATNGLGAIETYLRHLHRAARVVTCVDDNLSMRLPARAESVQQISYSRWDDIMNVESFPRYLTANQIEFLIMPRDEKNFPCSNFPAVHLVADRIAEDPNVTQIGDASYVMYDLSHWRKPLAK